MDWENKKLLAENTLKTKYNNLLQKYNKLEDGSVEIVSNPVYKKINQELSSTAKQIASLRGYPVEGIPLFEVFKNNELLIGFSIN